MFLSANATTDGEKSPCGVTVASGVSTDQGLVRRGNEDSYIARFPLFVVADGMGGHRAGEVASAKVIEEMSTHIPHGGFADSSDVLAALYYTTRSLSELGRSEGAPGSTMTGIVFSTHAELPCVRIFNIGDSRVYRYRSGELTQLTVDHTEYQELCALGFVESVFPEVMPRKHVLTKALGAGFGASFAIDQLTLPAVTGDRYLLCSDGLHGEVSDEVIMHILAGVQEPQEAAQCLVKSAIEAGGRDNVTVVVVDVCEAWPSSSSAEEMVIDADLGIVDGDTLPEDRAARWRTLVQMHEDNGM